jgi:hypothetical protein
MKNKKGLSQIVSTVVLILLTVAIVAGVWATVQNLVEGRLDKTGACYGLFEKITLNHKYICYDSVNSRMQVSISIGEVDIDTLLVSISSEKSSKTFELTNNSQNIENVTNYPTDSPGVSLPSKEGGKTYYVSGIEEIPDKVEIAPKVGGYRCDVVDSLPNIDICN